MRHTADEKHAIIRLVEGSDLPVRHTLRELQVHRSTLYARRSAAAGTGCRYIIAWAVRTSMQTADVTETRDLARATTGVDRIRVVHRPRLLSDNGPGYVLAELAAILARPDQIKRRTLAQRKRENLHGHRMRNRRGVSLRKRPQRSGLV